MEGRHNIKYRSVCGENGAVDKEVCEDWKDKTLLPILERYNPNNVYNADETGLYWRLLPDKTMQFQVKSKVKKGSLSLCVLIMTDSDILPL